MPPPGQLTFAVPAPGRWILIPLNPTPGSKWTASRPECSRRFVTALEAHGNPVSVRNTRGSDSDGACEQLAAVHA